MDLEKYLQGLVDQQAAIWLSPIFRPIDETDDPSEDDLIAKKPFLSGDPATVEQFTTNYSYARPDVSFRVAANKKKLVTVEIAALAHQMFAEEVINVTMASPFAKTLGKIQSKVEGWITEKGVALLEDTSWLGAAIGFVISVAKEKILEYHIRALGAKYRAAILEAHLFSKNEKRPVGPVMYRVRFKNGHDR